MLTNNAQVVQFYSAPLACFADALDRGAARYPSVTSLGSKETIPSRQPYGAAARYVQVRHRRDSSQYQPPYEFRQLVGGFGSVGPVGNGRRVKT